MGPKARTVKFYSTVSDRAEVVHLIAKLFNNDGGPGSGNFGHEGRPGKVGGSGKGEGDGTVSSSGSGRTSSGTKERRSAVGKTKSLAKSMVKLHIAKGISDRQRMINSLQDEVEYFSKMKPEEYADYIEKHFPANSNIVTESESDDLYHFVDPKELLKSEDHFAMFASVYQYANLSDKELVRCIEDKDFCKNVLKNVISDREAESDREIDAVEWEYDSLPDRTSNYKYGIINVRERDKKNEEKFGANTTPTEEYFRMVEKAQKDISFEDYSVQKAYINGGFGINAERLNRKMFSGDNLTKNEKKFVEILRNTATELPEDVVLYRMVNNEGLKGIFGTDSPEEGTETKPLESFGSSCCGGAASWWSSSPVCIRYHMKKGQKAIILDNKTEGEVLLMNGLKGNIKSVKKSDEDLPVYSCGVIDSMEEAGYSKSEKLIIDIEVTDDGSHL